MTQDIYSGEEAKQRFKELPPEIQNLLYSEEMFSILRGVGEKFKLHVDQLALLQATTTGVMLGFTDTEDFPKKISAALNIEESIAQHIAQEVSNSLFVKIRESMKKASATTTQRIQSAEPEIPSTPLPVIQTAEVHPVDMTLAHTTITTTPAAPLPVTTPPTVPSISTNTATPTTPTDPSKPKPYSTDPYREPVE